MNYQRMYDYRFRGISNDKKAAVWRPIARHIQSFMPRAEKILDPCAGRCEFVNHVTAREVWAVDREGDFIQAAGPQVKTIVGDIFEVDLPENYFDGVYVSNFLEHLENADKAARFIRRMRTVLSPGGRIVIMGPNFKYCAREYFDCIDHKLILTHRSVEELLYSENFNLLRTIPRYLPYSFRGSRPISSALTRLYLKLSPAWKLFGKQFIVIAENPGDAP